MSARALTVGVCTSRSRLAVRIASHGTGGRRPTPVVRSRRRRAEPGRAAVLRWGASLRQRQDSARCRRWTTRSEIFSGNLAERITAYPFQASLLRLPVRGAFGPYLLGGVGWYSQKIQQLSSGGTITLDEETTRKMGYHGGFGAEVRVHRHVGLYGGARYIRFGDDDCAIASTPSLIPFAERLKLSHEGWMCRLLGTVLLSNFPCSGRSSDRPAMTPADVAFHWLGPKISVVHGERDRLSTYSALLVAAIAVGVTIRSGAYVPWAPIPAPTSARRRRRRRASTVLAGYRFYSGHPGASTHIRKLRSDSSRAHSWHHHRRLSTGLSFCWPRR